MAAPRMNFFHHREQQQQQQQRQQQQQQQHQQQQQQGQHFFNDFFFGANNLAPAAMEEQRRREQEHARRERGPPPASRTALKNIPDVKIASHDLNEETNRSCSVCLDDHELGEMAVKLPCAHIFHRECVWEWLELHCTCPVCRFELETEDSNYEKERKVRMQGRRPRYHRRELEALTIPQIRNLARGQNVSVVGCLEKVDIVRRIAESGTVEIIESATPEYDADDLAEMSTRQLRAVMLQAGIDVEGCLEKADLLERVLTSRLIRVTHRDPPQPPPPPATSSTSGGEGGNGSRSAGSNQSYRTTRGQQPTTRRPWWGGRTRPAPAPAPAPTAGGRSDLRSPPTTERRPERPVPPTTEEPRRAEEVPSSLESMSVKELRAITSRLGISTAGCIEKRDMVERIRGSGRYHPEQEGGEGGAGYSR